MTTYYYELADSVRGGCIEADSDEEAKKKTPENRTILYRESDTEDGLPFIVL